MYNYIYANPAVDQAAIDQWLENRGRRLGVRAIPRVFKIVLSAPLLKLTSGDCFSQEDTKCKILQCQNSDLGKYSYAVKDM